MCIIDTCPCCSSRFCSRSSEVGASPRHAVEFRDVLEGREEELDHEFAVVGESCEGEFRVRSDLDLAAVSMELEEFLLAWVFDALEGLSHASEDFCCDQ